MMFSLYAAWYLEACTVYGAYSLGVMAAAFGRKGGRHD